ncbi:MAG: hypothetical protein OET90_03240, partial [Desulfuromonadales bacterium]|nr:hypothetical protein [Desulfuromonadales bacterium]
FFSAPEKKQDTSQPWFAPKRVDASYWRRLANLDMNRLKIDPEKDWQVWGKDRTTPIAEGAWAPVKMFVTHKPEKWGNNPKMHLYAPLMQELPGVLSALGYRVDEPAPKDGPVVRYQKVDYWRKSDSGEIVVKHKLQGKSMDVSNFTLATGLEDNEKLTRLKGEVIFRLPTKTQSSMLVLNELWDGATVDGVTVTLTEIKRGMFPGYQLKAEGAIEKLVNLHGRSGDGERVAAYPINYQSGDYWTMTLPFGQGIEEVELITAAKQEVLRYPFDFKTVYQNK